MIGKIKANKIDEFGRYLNKPELQASYPSVVQHDEKSEKLYNREIIWLNVVLMIYLHVALILSVAFYFDLNMLHMYIFTFIHGCFGIFGTNAGTHELWSHQTYKASHLKQLILIIAHASIIQKSIFDWARDHRSHYKYSHTNADPCNPSRGFFFTHMGWLMCRKHPDVIKYGSKIDMTDLKSDRLIQVQQKYCTTILMLLANFAFPIWVCCSIFGASLWIAFNLQLVRNVISLHLIWSIVSFVHFTGVMPYRKQTAQWEKDSS